MRLYVGNLSFKTTEETLRTEFGRYGTVKFADIVTDRETGRSKGFGFVDMPNDEEAKKAIEAWNDRELDGRPLRVNEARPRAPRPGGGNFGRPRRQ
ncbi:MAG: RNA-binding protein [Thermoguttaceae bacterium]|nr:RNA-binding protein [Thermoguttaceae bacterium]